MGQSRCGRLSAVDPSALRQIAADNHGVFTRAHARECGFSDGQIRHRVRRGEWRRVLGPVFAPAGVRVTASVRDVAAQLAIPGAVLSGPSAARRYGFDLSDARTCVTAGPAYRTRLPAIVLLRDRLDPCDVRLTDGLLMTSRERAVFDCLRLLPDGPAQALLDRALLLDWTTVGDLVVRVRGHVGRRGAPRLVRLLRQVSDGSRSAAERVFLPLLRRAGVTGWHANYRVVDRGEVIGIVDAAFPAHHLAVEIDGWAYHHMPERFQGDRRRQNRLVAAGWTVLRFTWRDLTERPDEVVRTVVSLLAERVS